MPNSEWAITDSLAGINCVALKADDFDVLASRGASMVWSPLSNLLLYGQTADVAAAKKAGIKIGIGPDWAPSGSKNLLGELKVAWLASAARHKSPVEKTNTEEGQCHVAPGRHGGRGRSLATRGDLRDPELRGL